MSRPAHWDWAPGDAGRLAVHYRQPGGEPVDLTGATAEAVIETPDGAMPVAAALDAAAGVVTLTLAESLTHPARYAITLIYSDGSTAPLLTGALVRIGGAAGHDWRVPALTGGRLDLRYRQPGGDAVDLTGVTISAVVESGRGSVTPNLDVEPSSGRITLALTADQARDLGADAHYTVTLAWPGGIVAGLVTGAVVAVRATAVESLLPSSASDLERALEQVMAGIGDLPIGHRALPSAASAPAQYLPWLAWEAVVDVWDSGWDEATKRAVIEAAVITNRHRGTPWAVEHGLAALEMEAALTEWFEADPPEPPYTFQLTVTRAARGFSARDLAQIGALVRVTKNTRSHLSGITMDTTAPHAGVHYGTACLAGTVTTLTPPPVRRLSRRLRPRHAAGLLAGTITTLQPMDADG